jgi:alpha-beta hydrolase superfamily lysophospholipase
MLSRSAVRALRPAAAFLVLALAAWLLASFAVGRGLTRRARPPFPEPVPEVAWGAAEELRLGTRDGEELGAWLWSRDAAGPSVLLLHGNGGSRGGMLPEARAFVAAGCAVLALTLRAHGDSTGATNDLGRSAALDVAAGVELCERARPGRPVVVCGTSLGAAAAIFAAEELGSRVAGYVLQSPYTNLVDAVRHRTAMRLPPVLDRVASLGLVLTAGWHMRNPRGIAPIEHVDAIPAEAPVLVLAGELDRHAPLADVQRIVERLGSRAELVVFPGAAHVSLCASETARYAAAIARLLGGVRSRSRGGR